jgi:uncharacterized protein Veg
MSFWKIAAGVAAIATVAGAVYIKENDRKKKQTEEENEIANTYMSVWLVGLDTKHYLNGKSIHKTHAQVSAFCAHSISLTPQLKTKVTVTSSSGMSDVWHIHGHKDSPYILIRLDNTIEVVSIFVKIPSDTTNIEDTIDAALLCAAMEGRIPGRLIVSMMNQDRRMSIVQAVKKMTENYPS